MRRRLGFVSNSSSSSFITTFAIVGCPKNDKSCSYEMSMLLEDKIKQSGMVLKYGTDVFELVGYKPDILEDMSLSQAREYIKTKFKNTFDEEELTYFNLDEINLYVDCYGED